MKRMPSSRCTWLLRLAMLPPLGLAGVFVVASAQEPPPSPSQPRGGQELTTEQRMRERREQERRGEAVVRPTTDAIPHIDPPVLPPPPPLLDRPDPNNPEWVSASETMKKHMPNWWRRFERLPPDAPWRPRAMKGIVERHRELQRVQQRDPEQYKREIEQIELEDEILGLARDARREADEERGEELRKLLREKVSRLVDVRLRNREARIERLAEQIKAERGRLEEAKRDRDSMIERNLAAVLNRPEGNPLGGGGVGRPDFAAPPRPPRDRDRDREDRPPQPPDRPQ